MNRTSISIGTFMTKFFVCLLLAGVATLAVPRAVQAQVVTITNIQTYVSEGPSAATTDIVGTDGVIVPGLAPLTATTAAATTLGVGSVIGIAVTFSMDIEATNFAGSRLRITIGTGTSKNAASPLGTHGSYVYGYGTGATANHVTSKTDDVEWNPLVYIYTVEDGDTGRFSFTNTVRPLKAAPGSTGGIYGPDGTTTTYSANLEIPTGVTVHWPSAEATAPKLSTPAAGDYPIQYVNSSGTPLDAAPRPGGTGAPSRYHHIRQEHLDLQGDGIGGAAYTAQAALVNDDGWSKPALTNSRKASYWREGDVISIRFKFNEPVKVDTTNKPTLMLGGEGVQGDEATLTDADATDGDNLLTFHYTVGAHDDNFGGITLWNNLRHNRYDSQGTYNWADDTLLPNPKYITDLNGNPLNMSVDLETPLKAYLGNDPDLTSWKQDHPGSSYTLKDDGYKETTIQYLVDPIRPNVYIPGLIKNGVTHTDDKSNEHITLTTLRAAADVMESAAQTGAFDVEFRFSNVDAQASLSSIAEEIGESFEGDDVKIAGDDVTRSEWGVEVSYIGLDHRSTGASGIIWNSASYLVYKATITPPVDYDGNVTITVPENMVQDIAGNGNRESNALTVPIISVASTLGVPTKGTRTLPSVPLPAKGFVVLAHSGASVSNTGLAKRFYSIASLPNLENLFGPNGNGGTLELIDKRTTATVGPIITEIMWGTDLSQTDSKLSQWLEIYNAGAATNLSNYQLKVTPFSTATFTADAKAVDTVGNLGDGKWSVPGQSGRTEAVAASTINPDGIAAVPLISMRRKITFADAKVEEGALKGVNNGTLSGSWEASTVPALQIGANRLGSPGIAHVTQITRATQTDIPYSPVIINEIGNNTGDANDWIELRNVSDDEVNLKKWELNIIVPGAAAGADPDEKNLVSFPDLDYKLGAGQVLLIVNTSPRNSPLARGKKFGDADGMTAVGAAQGQGGILSDAMFYDAKGGLNALPESGRFLLVLRKANNKEGTADEIVDITGTYFFEKPSLSTHIWPLQATPIGHTNVIDGVDDANGFAPGKVYKRNDAAGGTGEKDWGTVGYTGIGYDRSAANTDANGGTPGFPNGSLMDKESATGFVGAVTISEIMVNSNDGRQPQWIELRNSSQTQGINLNGWQLKIENVGDVDSRKNVTISLPDKYYLPPNQTMLIATRSARSSDELTATRVIVLWDDAQGARNALEVNNARFTMLSTKGFTLYLFEKDQNAGADEAVDTVTMSEDMLTAAKIGDGSERISLIRHHESGVWKPAIETAEITNIASDVYYGNATDIGTPGWSPGDALPVSLSSFLPKRTDAGVVIKWTTQSELNNAGFNILRSATKTGAFVVINPTMIQGAGTTGEKHTYSYTDKTAKPNVVYYYQIEDVSFDGHRQRLTDATRLRGHIGAAGKLTTTWGGLKVQD